MRTRANRSWAMITAHARTHVYDQLAPHFTNRDRVVSMTQRWHGTSDTTGPNFDLDTLASDIAGFIDGLTDQPAVVVGWATAGLELPRLARQWPDLVKGPVFANAVRASAPRPPGVPKWPPGGRTPDSLYPSLEAAMEERRPDMSIRSSSALRDVLAGSLYRREDGRYAWLPPVGTSAESRLLAFYDSPAVYDGVNVPVLAIQVELSKSLAAHLAAQGDPRDTIDLALRWTREYDDIAKQRGIEALRAAVSDVEVVAPDDVGHNFVIDSPEVVAGISNAYLDRFER